MSDAFENAHAEASPFLVWVEYAVEDENWQAIEPEGSCPDYHEGDEDPEAHNEPLAYFIEDGLALCVATVHLRNGPLMPVLSIQPIPITRSDERPGP